MYFEVRNGMLFFIVLNIFERVIVGGKWNFFGRD